MARDSTWTNQDGLVVGFGKHTVDNDVPAIRGGTLKTFEVEYDLSGLSDTFSASDRKPQEVILPRGSLITSAYVVVLEAAAGATAAFQLGTWGTGDVVDDANGIANTISQAAMDTVGEVHICAGALVNASGNTADAGVTVVGATSDSDCVLAPSYETAAFTAGRIRVTIDAIVPAGSTGGSIAA